MLMRFSVAMLNSRLVIKALTALMSASLAAMDVSKGGNALIGLLQPLVPVVGQDAEVGATVADLPRVDVGAAVQRLVVDHPLHAHLLPVRDAPARQQGYGDLRQ